jgi:hypothetical protein
MSSDPFVKPRRLQHLEHRLLRERKDLEVLQNNIKNTEDVHLLHALLIEQMELEAVIRRIQVDIQARQTCWEIDMMRCSERGPGEY